MVVFPTNEAVQGIRQPNWATKQTCLGSHSSRSHCSPPKHGETKQLPTCFSWLTAVDGIPLSGRLGIKKMKVIPLTIGAWNERTLMDSAGSCRPHRRIALVGRALDRYKIEIVALSETRLAEEGLLKEVGAGYTFFWSGHKKEERRESGVGLAVKSHIVSKLSRLPKGINDRLMTLRFPLSGKRHTTILSAYDDQPRWG